MKSIVKVLAIIVPLAIAGWVYAGLTKIVDPLPAPPELIALEDALAGPDLVGLFYVDMNYMVRLKNVIGGARDPFALTSVTNKDDAVTDSLLEFLRQSGLRVDKSVDYLLGGFIAREKGVGKVQVALGSFPVDTLARHWKKDEDVKQTEVNGRTAWLWTPIDVETCKASPPEVLIVEKDRLITGDIESVSWFLNRLESPDVKQDLSYWRNYRKDKLFSFAVFIPKNLKDIPRNMFVKMFAHAAQKKMVSVTGIYGGGKVNKISAGLDMEVLLNSSDKAWNLEQHKEFQKWKKETIADIDPEFKSVKNILGYLDSESSDEKLVLKANINKSLFKDIGGVVKEGVNWFASSISSSMSMSGGEESSAERIIPAKDVNPYNETFHPDDLDPFDSTANSSEYYDTTSGPFGITIKNISMYEKEEDVIELELEATSSHIPKINIDAFSNYAEGSGAWFNVTHVFDKNGNEILREENCGKDRNTKYKGFQNWSRTIETDHVKKTPQVNKLIKEHPKYSQISTDVFYSTKKIRLKPNVRMEDIETIEGEFFLQLPKKFVKKRIYAPFKDKVVQAAGVRIKMEDGSPSSVNYQASGDFDNLVEVRALNGSGDYISFSSSMSSELHEGVESTNMDFAGEPKTVEFVLADKKFKATYPYIFQFKPPNSPENKFHKPFQVKTSSKKIFLQHEFKKPKGEVCRKGSILFESEPFYLCMSDQLKFQDKRREKGTFASGSLYVHVSSMPEIPGNLSAVQVQIDKVIARNKNDGKEQLLAGNDEIYLDLRSQYVSNLKGALGHISAGPIDGELKDLKPVGFAGHLIIRLPRKLDATRLDLSILGSSVKVANGLKVQYTGRDKAKVFLKVEGASNKLVQFLPRDGSGKPLKQGSTSLNKPLNGEKGYLNGEIEVSSKAAFLDVVYATEQDIWEVPFQMKTKPPAS